MFVVSDFSSFVPYGREIVRLEPRVKTFGEKCDSLHEPWGDESIRKKVNLNI